MEAQAQLSRALALHTEALGAEHPVAATDINHLGLVLHDLGDLDGAHAAFERALAIDEAALGHDHPSVARDANNLAGVLRDMGDGFSAREALDWSLSIYMKTLGPDHPDVAMIVLLLADVYARSERGEEAEKRRKIEELVSRVKTKFGADGMTRATLLQRETDVGGVSMSLRARPRTRD